MKTIDGDRLRNMFMFGVYKLNENREILNSLNIFPVPDGDTGTNMSLTFIAAVNELSKLDAGAGCDAVAAAVASGSLRGARGNSGVILSQLFRGFSKGIKGMDVITSTAFAEALRQSSETAYKAVMKPKEGTVLTVAREAAQFAEEIAPETEDFAELLKQLIMRSNAVLKQTTNMLPALKAAGVVDAGGKGLVHIYEGFFEGLLKQAPAVEKDGARKQGVPSAVSLTLGEEIKFEYCTEFIIDNVCPTEEMIAGLAGYLESVGDSVVAVGDERLIKIHVHSNCPGAIIEHALKIGSLSSIKIENMRIQHTELISSGAPSASPAAVGVVPDNTNRFIGVAAISAGDGINGIFRELGCDSVIEGGQTMNPSADDIFKAAEKIDKKCIIILPNNKNIILAAEQAAKLLEKETGREVLVVPTKSIPQGIGAMIAMAQDKPLSETAEDMAQGAKNIKTGLVTKAIRETVINGKTVKTGDFIGIIDDEIEFVEDSALSVGKSVCERFSADCELITVYYSDKELEAEGGELSDYVTGLGLECETYYGGQPVYTYVISAE